MNRLVEELVRNMCLTFNVERIVREELMKDSKVTQLSVTFIHQKGLHDPARKFLGTAWEWEVVGGRLFTTQIFTLKQNV